MPVKDRRALLAACLDGLDGQDFTDFEVIVVDDGSSDGSAEEAATRTAAGRPLRVLTTEGVGAVAARSAGVAVAQGDILAFTDSDCVPSPGWLKAGVSAIDAGADVVNGLTQPARPMLPLERSMGSGLEGLYPTCNVFYRRQAFESAGGFDQSAGTRWGFRPDRRSRGDGFGEDSLLGWRVARTGVAVHEPDAFVAHAVFPPDYRELLSRTARVGAFPALFRELPELRSTTLTRWGWQLGQRTRLPVYAAALAAILRRPRLLVVCVAWWAGLRAAELRAYPISWRRRFKVLPVEMLVDVVTAGSLAVGTATTRSIVL